MFLAIKDGKEQMVSVAGKGETLSFSAETLAFDWHLYMPSGIAWLFAPRRMHANVFAQRPISTIHITKQISVENPKLSVGLRILGA